MSTRVRLLTPLLVAVVLGACTTGTVGGGSPAATPPGGGTASPTSAVLVPASVAQSIAPSAAPPSAAAEPLGTPSPAAWCAFVIEANTKAGYMSNQTYHSGVPSIAQQQAILAEAMARQAYWLSVTPPDILAATQAELAYYATIAAWTATNGWTNLAAAPQPTAEQASLIGSLVPYQQHQCGIKFGG